MLQLIACSAGRQTACARSAQRPRSGSATSSSWQGRCLARSGTCEPSRGRLGPARHRHAERLRFPACTTAPGRPRNYLRVSARSAADTSPALPSSASRMSPRPGDFCRLTPSRARGRQNGPLAADHHFGIAGCRGSNADPGVAGASILCVARGAARKSRPSAGRVCEEDVEQLAAVRESRQHGTGLGASHHRAARRGLMFAQMSFLREHYDRARDRVQTACACRSTVFAARRIARSGPCKPGSGRPGHTSRRACPSAFDSRLAPGAEVRPVFCRSGNFVAQPPSRARRRQKG